MYIIYIDVLRPIILHTWTWVKNGQKLASLLFTFQEWTQCSPLLGQNQLSNFGYIRVHIDPHHPTPRLHPRAALVVGSNHSTSSQTLAINHASSLFFGHMGDISRATGSDPRWARPAVSVPFMVSALQIRPEAGTGYCRLASWSSQLTGHQLPPWQS